MHAAARLFWFRFRSAGISVPLLLMLSSCGMLNSCSMFRSRSADAERARIGAGVRTALTGKTGIPGEKLVQASRVTKFYQARNYAPLWNDGNGWSKEVDGFLERI